MRSLDRGPALPDVVLESLRVVAVALQVIVVDHVVEQPVRIVA
jgi:hypothetical protein